MKKKGFTVIEGVVSLAILSAIVITSTHFLSQMKVKAIIWDEKNVKIGHQTATLTRLATANTYAELQEFSKGMDGISIEFVTDSNGVMLNHIAKVHDTKLEVDFLVYFDEPFDLNSEGEEVL